MLKGPALISLVQKYNVFVRPMMTILVWNKKRALLYWGRKKNIYIYIFFFSSLHVIPSSALTYRPEVCPDIGKTSNAPLSDLSWRPDILIFSIVWKWTKMREKTPMETTVRGFKRGCTEHWTLTKILQMLNFTMIFDLSFHQISPNCKILKGTYLQYSFSSIF